MVVLLVVVVVVLIGRDGGIKNIDLTGRGRNEKTRK